MTIGLRPSLTDQVIETLEAWSLQGWPRSTYIYGDKGEIYVRWTPELQGENAVIQARFTLANVKVYEEHRGQGIFKEMLRRCCESSVPVIRLECIQNQRLARYAQEARFPDRRNVETGNDPITMDWVK